MKFVPSLLFNNVFDPVSRDETRVMDYYKKLNELNYYQSFETRLLFNESVRKEYREFIQTNSLSSTIWLTSNLNKEQFSLSDTDKRNRMRSIGYMKTLIDLCVESGAEFIGFVSGKRIKGVSLAEQQEIFEDSLFQLLNFTKQYAAATLLLEPLDVKAHKCGVVGKSSYGASLVEKVIRNGFGQSSFTICIDTAHMALNQEELNESLVQLAPYSQRIHFANAVLAKEDPLYGDHHLPIGEYGFLNETVASDLLNKAKKAPFADETVYTAVEVRGKAQENLFLLEKDTRNFLSTIIQQ